MLFGTTNNFSEKTKIACSYTDPRWRDSQALTSCMEVVQLYLLKSSWRNGTPTPLMPFEIELLNNGYKLSNYCELNAFKPSRRVYTKGDSTVAISFGTAFPNKAIKAEQLEGLSPQQKLKVIFTEVPFSFELNNSKRFYQVSNDLKDFKNATEGKLTSLR